MLWAGCLGQAIAFTVATIIMAIVGGVCFWDSYARSESPKFFNGIFCALCGVALLSWILFG